MGRYVKKYITWKGKKLHSTVNGEEVRVAFDGGYGKNGGYRLYVNNKKIAQSTRKKDIAKEYFNYIDGKPIHLPAASIINKITVEYNVIWVNINQSYERIEEFIVDFIGCLPDDTLECTLEKIIEAREIAKTDSDYEPHIFNMKADEIFICINNKAHKLKLLQELAEYLNYLYPSRVASDREWLEQALFLAGTATKNTIEQTRKHWGEDNFNIISDAGFDKLFQNHKYEVVGNTICRIEPEIDKDYIVRELAKLLKEDKHSLAALTGIPELAHYDELSDNAEDPDQE